MGQTSSYYSTLQILLHADGELRCNLLLIFHSKSDKKSRPFHKRLRAEYKLYDPQVVVQFNKEAYENTDLMIEWIRLQYAHSSAYPFRNWEANHKPRMLLLNVFKGQLNNNKVLAKFKHINCTCSFILGRTTGFIQVCDVKPLKDRIAELAEIHYDAYKEQWIENKYSVSDRQVMLISWVAQAWDDLHQYNSESIRQAFRDVGLALPTNRSRDNEIKIKDLPGIQVYR
jgi:hypothetical protein